MTSVTPALTRRAVRFLATVSAYVVFGLGGSILSWVVLPVVWCWGGSVVARRMRCQRVLGAGLRIFHWHMRACGIIDFDPKQVALGHLRGLAEGTAVPTVLIANHPTLVDTPALLTTFRHLCCIVPSGYFRNPLFLPMLVCCGHIEARDKSISSGMGVLQVALRRLAAGHSLLIFPEGTRSPSHGLGAFKRGAFEIALQAQVPVQPVVIRTSEPILNRSMPWHLVPERSVRYQIEVLPQIPMPTATEQGLRQPSRDQSNDVRDRYAEVLNLTIADP